MGWFHKVEKALERVHLLEWIAKVFGLREVFMTAVVTFAAAACKSLAGADIGTAFLTALIAGAGASVLIILFALVVQRYRRPVGAAQKVGMPGYMSAKEAIHYMADESLWGSLKAQERSPELVLFDAMAEFRDRAAEGKICTYGISPATHEHEEIPKEHWMSFGLEALTVLKETDDGGSTEQKGFVGGFYDKPGYTGLRITAQDVVDTWPKRS